MSDVRLYNSLTRQKEVFKPLDPSKVTMYACGPTVYNYAHIGNARMAVVFDLLARVLRTRYDDVVYVSNITDVDDKIMAAAQETGEAISAITRKYTKIYNEDMAALGCDAPTIQPKATEHIGEMIAQIEALIERGHAYAAEGHVLFHVPSFENYGGLSGRSRDEQIAGARVEVASYKKDPADFVLWKPSAGDEPGWDSPWGYGRPGWHIECSAMAEKHLGYPFDIHGGGADLKFPHHENEIAQGCCASGSEGDLSGFAKYWVHNGFVTVEGEKMSKSLGNVMLVHDLVQEYKGPVLRIALLSAQYSKPLDWSVQRLREAEKLYEKIQRVIEGLSDVEGDSIFDEELMAALYDDLNSPLAFVRLNALLGDQDMDRSDKKARILGALDVLGVELVAEQEQEGDPRIDSLLEERQAAKAAKNFARADEIRDQLNSEGVEIIDTPEGSKWKRI